MSATDDSGTASGPALFVHQRGAGPRLVLAHGFTQTGGVWGGIDRLVATDRNVVAVDLPGHGDSAAIAADLPTGATLLGDAGGMADYLGYSMGARFCLHLALSRPDLVRRLILISGTAGIDDHDERAARRFADEALAARLDPVDGGAPEDTVAEFIARWMANPMFGSVPDAASGVSMRLTNTASGLASSLRMAGTGTQEPLWSRLSELCMPILVITGERDAKFTDLGQRLVNSVSGPAAHLVVDDGDHAPHLQQPDLVSAAVRQFLGSPQAD